jgi:hypothetical protein
LLRLTVAVFVSLLFLAFPQGLVRALDIEEVPVNIYIISLAGVSARGIENMTRVADGVSCASIYGKVRYWNGDWGLGGMFYYPIREEIPTKISIVNVTEWSAYRILMEYVRNAIIVNTHGEILPVPVGYSREDWVDVLADAMLNRNVTWVHVGGHPLRYCWLQSSGEELWGDEGFERMMSWIGKSNVTCSPPNDYKYAALDIDANQNILVDYPHLNDAYVVYWGCRLNETVFKSNLVPPLIYTFTVNREILMPAMVTKFARDNETESYNFGFYVHFAVGQTYDSWGEMSERDYYVGYAATAVATIAQVRKRVSIDNIRKTESLIAMAKNEGRTKGLEEATTLLEEAKAYFNLNWYEHVLQSIIKANTAIEEAAYPSFLDSYGSLIGVICTIAVVITGGGFATKKRNNRHNNQSGVKL